jgi:hypothetical protein
MHRNSSRENREISCPPAAGGAAGREGKPNALREAYFGFQVKRGTAETPFQRLVRREHLGDPEPPGSHLRRRRGSRAHRCAPGLPVALAFAVASCKRHNNDVMTC